MGGLNLRLLVTGSRRWDHPESVAETLSFYTRLAFEYGERLTVVHGKAREGGDDLAASWATRWGRRGWPVDQEPHPANWGDPCGPECNPGHRQTRDNGSEWCPYAGHRRNAAMVDTGVHACVGFWRNGSSGTRDCLQRAEKAGLLPLVIRWADREQVNNEWLLAKTPGFQGRLF